MNDEPGCGVAACLVIDVGLACVRVVLRGRQAVAGPRVPCRPMPVAWLAGPAGPREEGEQRIEHSD